MGMNKTPNTPTELRRNAVFLKNIASEIMEKAQKLEEETISRTCLAENGFHSWDQDMPGADNEDLGLNSSGLYCSECEALISQETYQKVFSIEATTGIKSLLEIPVIEGETTKENIDKAYKKLNKPNKEFVEKKVEGEEIVKCGKGHLCQYESCIAGGGWFCPICDRDEDDPKICEQCWKEFGRETSNHTTLEHLKDYLSDTIESYKREDYNKGKSKFRDEIEQDIKKLEAQIKKEEAIKN